MSDAKQNNASDTYNSCTAALILLSTWRRTEARWEYRSIQRANSRVNCRRTQTNK